MYWTFEILRYYHLEAGLEDKKEKKNGDDRI